MQLPGRHLFLAAGLFMLVACNGGGSNFDNEIAGQSLSDNSTRTASDPPADANVAGERMFSNLSFIQPVALLQHPQDDRRWYVVEQGGHIRTFVEDGVSARLFLDLGAKVVSGGEAGLLGMAFHPDFSVNGQVLLSYTGTGNPVTSYISRVNSNDNGLSADAGSEEILLALVQPFTNHNAGQIAFGPDDYLYVGLGDGGSGGDPAGNGQDTHTLLGAMLRIDVNQTDPLRGTPYAIPQDNPFANSLDCTMDGCPEILAWGFRNPWRWSFDLVSGQLWVGDVGQADWEEIDRIDIGRNYGWNILEGTHCFIQPDCDTTGLTPPITEYNHDLGSSVTGGYIYRGSVLSGFNGDYLYGDFGSGRIWRLIQAAQGGSQCELLLDTGFNISSFAQDRNGEIYIVSYSDGVIYKLVSAGSAVGGLQ